MTKTSTIRVAIICAALASALHGTVATASILYVAPGSSGTGTATDPFGTIRDALAAAGAGDDVVLKPGTYAEPIRTVRGGTGSQRLVIRAETPGTALVTSGQSVVLRVSHPYVTVRGLVIDGAYGPFDTVLIDSGATALQFQQTEVRRSGRDCIDMRAPKNVVVDGAYIHHCLNAAGGRTDAHGLVAGSVRNLVIRGTRIHTFSGDAVQLDPARSAPGWDQVTIERCQFWLEPLEANENGFPAGTVPGENALDTKTLATARRARIRIRETEAWGFRGGLLPNMAAFNIKENVEATFDRVTVSQSQIAFRLRGPGTNGGAWVRVQNAVVHDVATGVRYEDDIERVDVWNLTFGLAVERLFQAASSQASGLNVQNVLFLGATRPSELAGASNLNVTADVFAAAAEHDYHLSAGSAPINAGAPLTAVATDRDGVPRPQQAYWDVGAYEWVNGPALR